MTTHKQYLFFVLGLVLAMVGGCGDSDSAGGNIENFSEGEIVYTVTYPELDPNGTLVQMLPSELKVLVKGNLTKTVFKTAASVLVMEVICDADTRKMTNTIAMFGDQFALELDSNSIVPIGVRLQGFKIIDEGKTDTIAGVAAKQLMVEYPGMTGQKPIMVSNAFNLKSPNWFTIYSSINEVLLEYDIVHYNILMHLKATKIVPKSLEAKDFHPADDCEYLSHEEFDKFVNSNLAILLSE